MSRYGFGNEDHVASDDMDSVLELIRQQDTQSRDGATIPYEDFDFSQSPTPEFEIVATASSSKIQSTSKPTSFGVPKFQQASTSKSKSNIQAQVHSPLPLPREEYTQHDRPSDQLLARIHELDAEVIGCRADIQDLQSRVDTCLLEREKLQTQLDSLGRSANGVSGSTVHVNGNSKANGTNSKAQGINYATESFDWTEGLKARMKTVFGIKEFRLCQEGVCNANMDRRDIVCIMPTGGGKSLTYQLPALLTSGVTLVISPLISLMTDQILHLQEAGIESAMLAYHTPKAEKARILQRLKALGERVPNGGGSGEKEIKLLYVTPEKMSKDKAFRSLLQKVDQAGKLVRIVIDEAHCVSQMGHDFRKDYKELHILRKIYPRVPIMAVSATCSPMVLKDLVSILGLKEVVDGTNAPVQGTTYFSSPLYRKNLHYRVEPKSDSASAQIEIMKNYILEKHMDDTGIVYCFSKKDTATVAAKLYDLSDGKIKTGVYHADIGDAEKHRLHVAWREGRVKVVCATIAFGMGIDKGDVRFVLHHFIPKSLEGFYQESGRAGRDGKDSDCVLYYRPQDATTMASRAASEKGGGGKLHAMLDFAEDLRRCRKVQFAEYFSHSSQVSISTWSTNESSALEPCGHCDNCTRPPVSVDPKRDVTLAAWQLLKILNTVRQQGGRMTVGKLAALARGAAKGEYDVTNGAGRMKETDTMKIDLEAVAGGKVEMSKLDIEHLIVRLTTMRYFEEEYQSTSYGLNVYIAPGQLAARLNHHTRQIVVAGKINIKLEMDFLKPAARTRKAKKKGDVDDNDEDVDDIDADDGADDILGTKPKSTVPKKRRLSGAGVGKGKAKAISLGSDEDDIDEYPSRTATAGKSKGKATAAEFDSDDMFSSDSEPGRRVPDLGSDEEGEEFDWSFSLREEPKARPAKRQKREKESGTSSGVKGRGRESAAVRVNIIKEGENEVMELLSSD